MLFVQSVTLSMWRKLLLSVLFKVGRKARKYPVAQERNLTVPEMKVDDFFFLIW